MAPAQSTVDMGRMEEALARQLAATKITDERRKREIEKLCSESDELRELQAKIKAAYLNKERSQQMTEKQYRVQTEIVSLSFLETLTNINSFYTRRNKMPRLTSRCSGTKKLAIRTSAKRTKESLKTFSQTSAPSSSRLMTRTSPDSRPTRSTSGRRTRLMPSFSA